MNHFQKLTSEINLNLFKKAVSDFFQQLTKLKLVIFLGSLVILIPVLTANILHQSLNVSFGQLTRDIVTLTDVPVYTGFMSQLTILVWSGSTAICFFCLLLFLTDPLKKKFFAKALLITTVLCLDDTFLLHDVIAPHFGFSEHWIYLSYVLFILFFLIQYHRFILTTNFSLLVIALSFFAVSILIDVFNGFGFDEYITEDSTKLAGAVFWFVYFVNLGLLSQRQKNATFK